MLRPPPGSDRPLRDHLTAIWKATGNKPPELEAQQDVPPELEYLWHWYWQIPKPITFTELHHWSQLTRRNLRAWEAELLAALSRAWV